MKTPLAFHFKTTLMAALLATLAGCSSPVKTPDATQNAGAVPAATGTATAAAIAPHIERQAIAPALYELAYSSRFNDLYVNSAGGFGKDAPASRLLRLNPATLAIEGSIELERRGFGMAFDEEAGRIYIGNSLDASVTVIDAAGGNTLGVVQLASKVKTTGKDGKTKENYPHKFRQLVLDKTNQRLYLPGLGMEDSALYVVNTATLKMEKTIPGMGAATTAIALDAKGGKIYVANHAGKLFVVDARTLELMSTHAIAVDQPLNLAFDSQRNRLYAVDQGLEFFDKMRAGHGLQKQSGGNKVIVLDPASGATIASLPTANGPVAMLIDEPRGRLYVSTREGASVDVFSVENYQLLHRFNLPGHPNSFTLDAATGAVYVSVKNTKEAAKGSNESVVRLSF